MRGLKLLAGSANRELSQKISDYLNEPIVDTEISRFSDGEVSVQIKENIRGSDVFLICSLSGPVNENIMEMLVMMDAIKRSSANSLTVVLPYYAYARQDRKVKSRVPISAKLMADLLTVSGANRIVAMDLHAGQIQGFFDIPVDHLYASPVIANYIRDLHKDDIVIVSPDAGGVERARDLGKKLGCSLAIVDKRRSKPNVSEVLHIIGDCSGKTAVLVDDLIDTAGTIVNASIALTENGAREVYACCTHPVLSGPALERIENSPIQELVITDTLVWNAKKDCKKIKTLSVANLIGEAIRRIYNKESVSSLFD
ncbi:Ribose-phosphate pyrophosphokinase [Desulfurella amilsii]|uniref:Ribose-phosphate pyrophosphokinase n=1 Tax=Desulfurella amilsii TaxID=1562698 RepID=A0A1X4XY01_9BACT|nr:ribose-phosphate pyrophosphokinase [Desulfurella amilsii]OSS42409.1 Ribose-phosphate pyrophosphokinase [Desulfurella amilsii]